MKTELETWCRHQKHLGIMLSEDSVFQAVSESEIHKLEK